MTGSRRRAVASLHGRPAGVVTRAAAGVIDYLVVGLIVLLGHLSIIALRFVTNPVRFNWPRTSWAILIVSGVIVMVCYLTISWSATGKTLGASIMGTRVVNRHGGRLGFAWSSIRAALVVVFPVGLLWCAVNTGGRSVQDVALRTRVLYDYDISTSYAVHEAP